MAAPTSSPRPNHRKVLTRKDKYEVIRLHKMGHEVQEISHQTNIPERSIRVIIRQAWSEYNSIVKDDLIKVTPPMKQPPRLKNLAKMRKQEIIQTPFGAFARNNIRDLEDEVHRRPERSLAKDGGF